MEKKSGAILLDKVLNHPANKSLVSFISQFNVAIDLETDWEKMRSRAWSIGTLPEVVDLLWIDFARKVPQNCRAIFMNRPVLFNPACGEIFGFATGTYTPMIKLRGEALSSIRNAIGEQRLHELDRAYAPIAGVGPDWVYCSSSLNGVADFFAEAYLRTCDESKDC